MTGPVHLIRGRWAEWTARRLLESKGLNFVQKNYRSRFGEIDLVMRDEDELVFVEVRFRSNKQFGDGAESVDRRKQDRLRKTAMDYLQRLRVDGDTPCRFDIVSITGRPGGFRSRWISNAF